MIHLYPIDNLVKNQKIKLIIQISVEIQLLQRYQLLNIQAIKKIYLLIIFNLAHLHCLIATTSQFLLIMLKTCQAFQSPQFNPL